MTRLNEFTFQAVSANPKNHNYGSRQPAAGVISFARSVPRSVAAWLLDDLRDLGKSARLGHATLRALPAATIRRLQTGWREAPRIFYSAIRALAASPAAARPWALAASVFCLKALHAGQRRGAQSARFGFELVRRGPQATILFLGAVERSSKRIQNRAIWAIQTLQHALTEWAAAGRSRLAVQLEGYRQDLAIQATAITVSIGQIPAAVVLVFDLANRCMTILCSATAVAWEIFIVTAVAWSATSLRACRIWVMEDVADIRHLVRLAAAILRAAGPTLAASFRAAQRRGAYRRPGAGAAKTLQQSLSDLARALNPYSRKGLEITASLLHVILDIARASPTAFREGTKYCWLGIRRTCRDHLQLRRARPATTRMIRARIALDRRCSDLRYWRNRTFRFTRSYLTDTPAREHALNLTIFAFGIAIATGGYTAIQYYSETRAQTDFERPGKEVAAFLTQTMKRHLAFIESAQTRFTAKKTPPSRWEFFQFTRDAEKELPGIQALEWAPSIQGRHLKRYQSRATKDGLFGFRFFGHDGKEIVKSRGEHIPLYYVEPYPGNEAALGFDLASDHTALEALVAARDTGRPVTTGFLAIDVGDRPKDAFQSGPGVVVVMPVYDTEILPFTTAERRKRITGYIRGVIRLDQMVQAYRSNLSVPPGLEVSFYSHDDPNRPRLRYHNPPLPANAKPLAYPKAGETDNISLVAGFDLLDQKWSMILRPESRLFLRNIASAAWAFVIFAVLTTAILLLYLVTSQTRTRTIQRSVLERTAELEAEITQRKQIEVELRAAKDDAIEANHAKSEFLAIMSHELRTPLNAISGFSEVMSSEVYGSLGHKNYGDYVTFIYDSANHLLSLINDILDLSKIEAERYEIHKEVINLGDAWRPVEEMLGEKIASAQITLEDHLCNSDIMIRADDRALRQIFLNLLSNAVKFTPEGGRIETRAAFDDSGRLIISVRDTGIGIAKEDLDLVFEPFKQIESKVARRHKGTGLGLPLTQRLVALHGGRVEIDSALGEGTTVRIILEPDSVVADDDQSTNKSAVMAGAVGESIHREFRIYAKG